MRHCIRIILLATSTAVSAARAQPAEQLFHVVRNTYGCANPRATLALTNLADPRQRDPGWVSFVVADGHCAPITPRSPWRLVSRQGDLAYMAYAGTTGLPGSFYLKASELAEIAPAAAAPLPPAPAPQAGPGPAFSPAPPLAMQAPTPPPAGPAKPLPQRADSSPGGRALVASGYIDPPEARAKTPDSAPAPSRLPGALSASPERASPGDARAGGNGGLVIPGLIGLAVLAWIVRLMKRSPGAKGRVEPKAAAAPPAKPAATRAIAPAAAPPPLRSGTAGPRAAWVPKGAAATVAGRTLPGGMLYIGARHPPPHGGSPCFIDPSLEIARSGPDTAGAGLPCWPSYDAINPRCRLAYLDWLSGGRSDPEACIGYVFLFFYGLERRLFVDGASEGETADIVAEVRRLRGIYGSSRSFARYSEGLLEAVEARRMLGSPGALDGFSPNMSAPGHSMPLDLKLAIAARVTAGKPLPFELAAAGVLGLPPDALPVNRRVLEHARPQLLSMLRSRFEAACPTGFNLRNRQDSRLTLVHRCATAGLQVDLASTRGQLPDPATLTWTRMTDMVKAVAGQLEPYAKRAAHRPAWTASLEAIAMLPPEARAAAAQGPARLASQWLAQLPKPMADVPFSDLARHVLGEAGGSRTPRRHEKVCEALATLDHGLEPSPGDHAADDLPLVLFPDLDANAPRSSAYRAAAVGAEIASAVARLDPAAKSEVEKAWVAAISQRLPITAAERLRLTARLRWSGGVRASTGRIRRGLAEASDAERAAVAWSAASAAATGGAAAAEQVAALEKVYDGLSLPRQDLYSALHAASAGRRAPAAEANAWRAAGTPAHVIAASSTRSVQPGVAQRSFAASPATAASAAGKEASQRDPYDDEPVFVAHGIGEIVHSIPGPPEEGGGGQAPLTGAAGEQSYGKHGGPAGQPGKVPAAEAAPRVPGQDAAPRPAGQPSMPSPATMDAERLRQIRSETERVSALLASVFADDEEAAPVAVQPSRGPFPGLDSAHAKLVGSLRISGTWSRADFEREAVACGLMPDGALEAINEWAYDRLGEPLIEDGDPLAVLVELLDSGGRADAA